MEVFIVVLLVVLIFTVMNNFKNRQRIKDLNDDLTKRSEEYDLKINNLNNELNNYRPIIDVEERISELQKDELTLKSNVERIKLYFEDYEYKVDIEEMSFYQPKYDFGYYLDYSDALDVIREAQKELIKDKTVFNRIPDSAGKNIANLGVNAFNNESSTIINSVTYNNFLKSKEKMEVTFNKINNLLSVYNIAISEKYLDLKFQEMGLVYDLLDKERRIKEEQDELKEQMREEEKARREAEKAREKAIKEQEKYEEALAHARLEVESKTGKDREKFEKQILALQAKLDEAMQTRERATAMAQITKEGHVYIISNIGSFGEDVYKIGMTRRMTPMDRVSELSGASVPFPFDVHAMIRTDNAPELENSLHKAFEDSRLNKVNLRKEFFRVPLESISEVCASKGYNVKLTQLAEAMEFNQTKDIERQSSQSIL